MQSSAQTPLSVWNLLEQLYLDAANKRAAGQYANLSETEKRTTLKDFTKRQAVTSKRWSSILQDILSADLDGWRQITSDLLHRQRSTSPTSAMRERPAAENSLSRDL
jgi:hypothetical protein